MEVAVKTCSFVVLGVASLLASVASGNHHFMQIQQVIGGVGGDVNAQAIQLRQRFAGQNVVFGSRLRVYDAAGLNPITLITFPSNVANGASGATILVATSAFAAKTTPLCAADFIMSNPIPAA